ncbi:MAG TPA: hypothetical protein VFM19_10125, partial [Candidatus Limnocylindria bacterium]|nr:hypothetical protein [Candidatus Limnocylindria bacterium]
TRWLRDAARGRPSLAWAQLLVPLPAFAVLLAGLVPFILLKPRFDSAPGGGLWLFGVALAAFGAVSAHGVWGPDRAAPDGHRTAILDVRAAFLVRLAIHAVFLVALLALGLATAAPVLLAVALAMLALEWPLAWLVRRRLASLASVASVAPRGALRGTHEPEARLGGGRHLVRPTHEPAAWLGGGRDPVRPTHRMEAE